MRNRTFQDTMRRLALLAMLLLVLMPTIGRVVLASVGHGAPACHAVQATMSGAMDAHTVKLAPSRGGWPAFDPAQGDCPYCPLLAALLPLAMVLLLLAHLRATRVQPAPAAVPRRDRRCRTGLGSRGPPPGMTIAL